MSTPHEAAARWLDTKPWARSENQHDAFHAAERASLAALLTEWKQLGEREGMERAARLAEHRAGILSLAERGASGRVTWPCCARHIASTIRAEAASLGTLKEPPEKIGAAAWKDTHSVMPDGQGAPYRPVPGEPPSGPMGQPESSPARAETSGASPQSETLRWCTGCYGNPCVCDEVHADEVRAAEQKVIRESEMVAAWRVLTPGDLQNRLTLLGAAVDELRAVKGKR